MNHILITGATGQVGSELTLALRKIYGGKQVIASGRKRPPPKPCESRVLLSILISLTTGP